MFSEAFMYKLAGVFVFIVGLCSYMLPAEAQTAGDISTIAGGNRDGGLAIQATLSFPRRVIVDTSGHVYIADTSRNRILKMAPDGTIATIAGTGVGRFSGDDTTATETDLNLPAGLTLDASGNLYIADTANQRIRKVDINGRITTVAGDGLVGFFGDGGLATTGSLNFPQDVTVDASGNLYIADTSNHRIRKVDTSGVITTIAGTGNAEFSGDGGPAVNAGLNAPRTVAIDVSGNLYIADTSNHRIRKVDTSGVITTIAGDGGAGFSGDGGSAVNAGLNAPRSIAIGSAGALYIADTFNHRIRKIDTGGTITTVAGDGDADFSGDGAQAVNAGVNLPRGFAVSQTGVLYIADSENNRIRKVEINGIISTVAGNGNLTFAGDGGPATAARFAFPSGIAVDATGQYFIADTENNRIRKVDSNGNIFTVAGNGLIGFVGDGGAAADARLTTPFDVIVDAAGVMYIVDTGSHRIRRVDTNGNISTVAGSDIFPGFSGDGGLATAARLASPRGVYLGQDGLIYISDSRNHRIRRVDTAGIITTIAGSGSPGFSGDGNQAVEARFNLPSGIHVDGIGNLYIADSFNHRIRKVAPDGTITTIAGDGFSNSFGEGRFNGDNVPALEASLNIPIDVAVDAAGQIYIADTANHRIRKIDTQGMITTVAGDGARNSLGDGRFNGDDETALLTSLFFPNGLTIDVNRNIYIADSFNHRIRQLIGEGPVIPTVLSVTNFTLTQIHGVVKVEWTLDQTPTTFGFNIYRSLQPDTGFVKINEALITAGTTSGVYTDQSFLESDQTYHYLLETVDLAGNTNRSVPTSVKIAAIAVVELFQNAPNPFNPNTVIRFALPSPAKITFRIYNILGQEVITVLDAVDKTAGFNTVQWDGTNQKGTRVSSGVYLYHLLTDTGVSRMKRMVLLR